MSGVQRGLEWISTIGGNGHAMMKGARQELQGQVEYMSFDWFMKR